MLNTLVTLLRKNAPGNITARKMVAELRRRGMVRAVSTITAFERVQFDEPDPEFVELYADVLGVPAKDVWDAYRKTQRQRKRAAGPFVAGSAAVLCRTRQRKRIAKKLLTPPPKRR